MHQSNPEELFELLPNTHPGMMLKEDFLEPLEITPYKLAKGIGLTAIHVSDILNGKRNITTFTSMLLGKYFDMSPLFWLNLQNRYDLIEAGRTKGEKLEQVIPFRKLEAALVG